MPARCGSGNNTMGKEWMIHTHSFAFFTPMDLRADPITNDFSITACMFLFSHKIRFSLSLIDHLSFYCRPAEYCADVLIVAPSNYWQCLCTRSLLTSVTRGGYHAPTELNSMETLETRGRTSRLLSMCVVQDSSNLLETCIQSIVYPDPSKDTLVNDSGRMES